MEDLKMRIHRETFLLILLLAAAPLYAAGEVNFVATNNSDGTCTVTFDANDLVGINPVAMALEIHVTGTDPCHLITDVDGIDPFFDIYMDYAYDIESDPCSPGYCYGCGSDPTAKLSEPGVLELPHHDFVICMAGLGGPAKPLTGPNADGTAFILHADNSRDPCNPVVGTISINALRGGVIGTDGEPMETNLPIPFSINNPCYHCDCCPPGWTQEECFAIGCPDCWCYQYQCRGDADGGFTGKDKTGKRQYVSLGDLTIFNTGWLKYETNPAFSTFICADFDHGFTGKDKTGKRQYVSLPDLTIFNGGWLKYETNPHFTANPCLPQPDKAGCK
jgi:hypothetical protein